MASTGTIIIDGVEYWQPECHCKGPGHICYIRPVPQVVNVSMAKIIKKLGSASGNQRYPKKA